MTTPPDTAAPPAKNTIEKVFDLDVLFDGLVSGRLCGQPFDPKLAQLLLFLLERLDWTPDARLLSGALPHFPEKFGVSEIRATLARLGFLSTEIQLEGRQLKACPVETLVADEKNDLWLLTLRKNRKILVRPDDLDEEIARIRRNRLYRAVQFERVETSAPSMPAAVQTGWISETISRFWPELRVLLAVSFLSGCAAILIAFGITTIFDTVIPTRNYSTLTGLIVGLGLIFAFDTYFRNMRANIIARMSGRLTHILGTSLLGKLLSLPPHMLSSVSLSDQMSRLRQFETIRDLFGGPVVLLLLEIPVALLMLAIVASLAWPIAALLTLYICLFTLGALLLAPAIRRETQKLTVAQSAMNRFILEIIEQRDQIARNALASIWLTKLDTRVRDLARARRRTQALSRWLEALSQCSLPLAASTAIGTGAILAMNGTLTGGTLIAVTILTWRLFAPVQQAIMLLPKVQDVTRLFQQIDTLMRLPAEESASDSSLQSIRSGPLAVRGLVLRHPKSISPVLMGVQFDIPQGSLVTVTGKSGSGKTSLLRVLAGQIEPQAGAVMFNGLNISQMSRAFRARNIAFVAQKPLFFYGSVAQFLRLGDPTADDARLLDVLRDLGLEDWVNGLPNGINTRLDPAVDGQLLSSSVLTSLAVAQAILTQPAILLMDEPAGNMEQGHEACLLAALESRRGTMTSVIITHRPSLIKRSDAVIVLNGGAAAMHETTKITRQAS